MCSGASKEWLELPQLVVIVWRVLCAASVLVYVLATATIFLNSLLPSHLLQEMNIIGCLILR